MAELTPEEAEELRRKVSTMKQSNDGMRSWLMIYSAACVSHVIRLLIAPPSTVQREIASEKNRQCRLEAKAKKMRNMVKQQEQRARWKAQKLEKKAAERAAKEAEEKRVADEMAAKEKAEEEKKAAEEGMATGMCTVACMSTVHVFVCVLYDVTCVVSFEPVSCIMLV